MLPEHFASEVAQRRPQAENHSNGQKKTAVEEEDEESDRMSSDGLSESSERGDESEDVSESQSEDSDVGELFLGVLHRPDLTDAIDPKTFDTKISERRWLSGTAIPESHDLYRTENLTYDLYLCGPQLEGLLDVR